MKCPQWWRKSVSRLFHVDQAVGAWPPQRRCATRSSTYNESVGKPVGVIADKISLLFPRLIEALVIDTRFRAHSKCSNLVLSTVVVAGPSSRVFLVHGAILQQIHNDHKQRLQLFNLRFNFYTRRAMCGQVTKTCNSAA